MFHPRLKGFNLIFSFSPGTLPASAQLKQNTRSINLCYFPKRNLLYINQRHPLHNPFFGVMGKGGLICISNPESQASRNSGFC